MENNYVRNDHDHRIGERREHKRERRNTSTIAIVALSILLLTSVVLGVTGAFFFQNAAVTGDITLGDPVNINLTQGGATVASLTFSGAAMPGTIYSQPIGVTAPADTSDAVLRGKLTITNADGAEFNVTATTSASWIDGGDTYYYYNGVLSATQSIDFVTEIQVPTTLTNIDANKTYNLNMQIESIQWANGAASEVWTTAPAGWVTAYGSGV
ncbi:MAG: hypothetical protein CVV59_00840 [Tenericutes bacterium HGW-Tenericutes-4]|nr:MAG: hypothetical protein CVV59_00840 [Tenericutes bacterium HGW-Tenericutes-4]